MTFEQVELWARLHDLVSNRVSIANQLLGARFDGAKDNPLSLSFERGEYVVTLCGERFATFGIYDLDSTQLAFDRVDALADGLWLIGRAGSC